VESVYKDLFKKLTKRYGGVDPQALVKVLCPILIPMHSLDKTIIRLPGQSHYRASFSIKVEGEWKELIQIRMYREIRTKILC